MSDSLLLLFKKERLWANRSRRSFKKANVSKSLSILLKKSNIIDSLVIRANCSQKLVIRLKKLVFFYHVFTSFSLLFPFLCPRSDRSRRYFFKSDGKKVNRYIALSLFCGQKTSDWHEKTKSDFQTHIAVVIINTVKTTKGTEFQTLSYFLHTFLRCWYWQYCPRILLNEISC